MSGKTVFPDEIIPTISMILLHFKIFLWISAIVGKLLASSHAEFQAHQRIYPNP